MAKRVSRDIPADSYVNLGIGIPTLVARFIPEALDVVLHSENGVLGMSGPAEAGQEDPDLVDAGKNYVKIRPGAAFFDHATSFAMVRTGRVDVAVMGAYEVGVNGDLANWSLGRGGVPGVGGAMDIAKGARQLWVAMQHETRRGEPKIVPKCTLPITAQGVVQRLYTNMGVFSIEADGLYALELAPRVEPKAVRNATGVSVDFSHLG